MALQSYESVIGCFPPGVIWQGYTYGPQRQNFHVHLFPYEDQANLYNSLYWTDKAGTGALWYENNSGTTSIVIPSLLCPSDGRGGLTLGFPGNNYARLNYFGVFTGMELGDLSYPGNPTPAPSAARAFFDANRCTKTADIRDGMSNTMCIAESLTGPVGYSRGFLWSDQPCGAMLFTQLAPNSPLPDHCYDTAVWCSTNDPALPAIADSGPTQTCAARSLHSGGVNVLMVNGVVKFVGDAIDCHPVGDPLYPGIWQRLATIAGGDVVPAF